MSWVFVIKNALDAEEDTLEARSGSKVYLTATPCDSATDTGMLASLTAPRETSSLAGIANIEPWGVKVQAVAHPLKIEPGVPRSDASTDPPTEYTLQPQTIDKTEVILLRADDSIWSPRAPGYLTLKWMAPQVQVNSSVTADREIPESEDPTMGGEASNSEGETEDDEEGDQTVVNTVHPPSCSTPLLSASREVIQETPTVGRVTDMAGSPTKLSASTVEETPPEESPVKAPSETEVFSTAPAKRHPTVKIPTKRSSPDVETDPTSDAARPSKRTKTDGDKKSTDSRSIQYPIRKTTTKAKHLSDEKEMSTSPRSQRSSQRSLKDEVEEYDGPTPRVVFSNSAIPESGKAAMKFLKANGARVNSINDGCNLLCVKDGALVKTMKLLQAIALGIPVVTDKWLLSSAKAGRFLALSSFIPSAPAQESEWHFSLATIWNKPQSGLFSGYTIFFTPTLKATFKPFSDMENVCKAAGARRVVGKKANAKDVDDDSTIVLAADRDDPDAKVMLENGRVCFTKDFLTSSILRGEMDRQSEEFRISEVPVKGGKKGRSKKS